MALRFKTTDPSRHIDITISLPGKVKLFRVLFLEVGEEQEIFGCLPSGRYVWTTTTYEELLNLEKRGMLTRMDTGLQMDVGL